MQLRKNYFIIILLGGIFFLPFLGGVHLFDWDEINFAECAREMLATDNYLQVFIDYQPFWEKPPLFIWMQVLAMKMFGVNEFAARLPNAICGIFTLCFLFFIGNKTHNKNFAWFWVLSYLGSILPHLYFRSGIIDPWFNLFIFSSFYFLVISFSRKENDFQTSKNKIIFYGGALLGLAVLTKGPAAILIVGLTFLVYWIWRRFKMFFSIPQMLLYGFTALLVTGLWFGLEIMTNGTWFVKEFITYQIRLFSTPDAGHGGFFGYHFVVLFFGCFPASIFALPSFFKKTNSDSGSDTSSLFQHDFRKWMLALFWVVLILFSIVQSKIVHYSSLCYFPLTYLSALYLNDIFQNLSADKADKKIKKSIVTVLLAIGSLVSLVFIVLPFVGRNIEMLYPLFENDKFALANLQADVTWNYWDVIPGLILLFALISFLFFLQKKENKKAVKFLFIGSAIFISSSLYFFINKIEGYSQNAAIEFYESIKEKDAYVKNVGFKSYAHLFYTQKPAGQRNESRDLKWLLSDKTDKEVYFITRIHDAQVFEKHPKVSEIGRKNGFVFFHKK